jgi:hypothetical protein
MSRAPEKSLIEDCFRSISRAAETVNDNGSRRTGRSCILRHSGKYNGGVTALQPKCTFKTEPN